jgi:hypothetical protein
MKLRALVIAFSIVLYLLTARPALTAADEAEAGGHDRRPLIATPIPVHLIDRPWYRPAPAGEEAGRPEHPASGPEPETVPGSISGSAPGPEASRKAHPPKRPVGTSAGTNLAAAGLSLANDFTAPDAITIVGQVQNTGTSTLDSIALRFTLGHPQQGGTQIGQDCIIGSLAPGATARDSVIWSGFDGSSRIYLLADPDGQIAESDEGDNSDSLTVGMVDQVPWVWQEVNGYCHYASQTMLFNYHGADNTVYETLELACCPHSVAYEDGELALMSGWMLSQAPGDLEFAGEIRNLSTDLVIRSTWSAYRSDLRSRVDTGRPFETSVDPYWLPQPDYDLLRAYGLHSGHGVVVVGYTDDAVIINDPGVGLDLLGEPPLPDPQNRGANVIVDEDTFRNAVEWTSGSSYLLLSYQLAGTMPTHDQMLTSGVDHSLWRLAGDAGTFDPVLWMIFDLYGRNCYPALRADASQTNFQRVFDDAMSLTGGDLADALNLMATNCDLWGCGICWNAGAVFYGAQVYPQAARLNGLLDRLSHKGDLAWEEFLDLLDTVYIHGGDTGAAEPYLLQIRSILDEIVPLQDSVLVELNGLYGHLTSVGDGGRSGRLPARAALACYPNPFNDRTIIRYRLDADGPVRLTVYNILGQRVRRLTGGHQRAGDHRIAWDGRDDRGAEAAGGIYLCRLETEGEARTAKLVLLR